MFTYNDIRNLFFVIINNISYNKSEVEKIWVGLQDAGCKIIWLVSYPVTQFAS